ncbi:MAG TPA: DUF3365 domain-containing protein [Candidatus Anammoximicrobium sp.]|nr:DUF3365 domain-containing protein [Candidatus Anammoximicrobium sp.]
MLTDAQLEQQQVALAARDAMSGRLLNKLTEVLGASGPVAAIEVCRQQAPQIAAETGQDLGVAIGRTSFRLRNPKNTPPEWARPLVEARPADPQFIALPDGRLGALLPIRLKAECLLCHGPRDQILPDIQTALETNYPEDQATGFQAGDLRGWFWVTVPAGARLQQASSISSSSEGGE